MESNFQHIELDQVRYSLVWEDHHSLQRGLELGPSDHALLITSAGCNVLNALLADPRSVTAIDLNPIQNRLLALKTHIIALHPYAVLHGILGLSGPSGVERAWRDLYQTLAPQERWFWAEFLERHPGGLLGAGRLERYLHGFLPSLPRGWTQKWKRLLRQPDVAAQRRYFERELDVPAFRGAFVAYFDRQNLSKGRDPKLFAYAEDSGGHTFFRRLRQQVGQTLLREQFYTRFLFEGSADLPLHLLPPCYRPENYLHLRRNLERLHVREGEAVDFLLSPAGQFINKASLSNIFEYTSAAEFQRVCRALFGLRQQPLRLIYWNLLQNQGEDPILVPWRKEPLSSALSAQEGTFYFRNVRVMETVPLRVEERGKLEG